jgi:hypothetical protein
MLAESFELAAVRCVWRLLTPAVIEVEALIGLRPIVRFIGLRPAPVAGLYVFLIAIMVSLLYFI